MSNPSVPEIQVVLVEDDEDVRHGTAQALELAGFTVQAFGSVEAARAVVRHDAPLVLLCDVNLPGQHATAWLPEVQAIDKDLPMILVTGHGDIAMAVQCMRQGAYDFIEKPAASERIVAIVQRAAEKRRLVLQVRALGERLASQRGIDAVMVGRSAVMQTLRRTVLSLAATTADVLIYGETGTGKELVARALHRASQRAQQPLVCVNCAAIPETLIESELFGYEKGAFTGAASNRVGLIEAADGGTLFLDEIGELPCEAQARLLRFIQEGEIRAIGAVQSRRVDVRLITATHRDLKALCDERKFRQDLYYRINVVELFLPPLRERGRDVLGIAEALLEDACRRHERKSKHFSPEAIQAITCYHWPGNVRELENAVERAVILSDGDEISHAALAIELEPPEPRSNESEPRGRENQHCADDPAEDLSLEDYFQRFVLQNQDHMSETELARKLGVSRKCLWERRQRFGIPRKKAAPDDNPAGRHSA